MKHVLKDVDQYFLFTKNLKEMIPSPKNTRLRIIKTFFGDSKIYLPLPTSYHHQPNMLFSEDVCNHIKNIYITMDISSHVMGIELGGLGASNNIFFNIYFLIRITDGFTNQKY